MDFYYPGSFLVIAAYLVIWRPLCIIDIHAGVHWSFLKVVLSRDIFGVHDNIITWWHGHGKETRSVLMVVCRRNPLVIGRPPHQKASSMKNILCDDVSWSWEQLGVSWKNRNIAIWSQVAGTNDACRCWYSHDGVIKWKHFLRYWFFVREIHRPVSNTELWCFLWSAPELTIA